MGIKNKIFTLTVTVLISVVTGFVSAEEWTENTHDVLTGDVNGDGYNDLYLKSIPTPQTLQIPYNIDINVNVKSGIKDVLLLSNADGTYTVVYSPDSALLNSITWTAAAYTLAYADYNNDGKKDVLVKAQNVGDNTYLLIAPPIGSIAILSQTTVNTIEGGGGDPSARTAIDPQAGNNFSFDSSSNMFVGAVNAEFNVSATGKPTYHIPLNMLPSIDDVAPKLTLIYNGTNANDIAGIGWHLQGLSEITRCQTTLVEEKYINGVNFNSSDKLCLNGQKLESVTGTYGEVGTEYRTKNETFSKIVSVVHPSITGKQYFQVWRVSGEIETYGYTTDSREKTQVSDHVITWSINKVQDRQGNYANFSYTNNNALGEHYISRIDYTGNDSAGLAPQNSIRFQYESRPDVTPSYANNTLSVIPVRIKNITTYLGSTAVRTYNLGYSTGNATSRSRLTSLQECIGSSCLPATVFTWDQGNEQVQFSTQTKQTDATSYPPALTYNEQQYYLADVNADGRNDLILTYRHGSAIGRILYLANTQNSGFTFASKEEDSGFNASIIEPKDHKFLVGDVNGDGKADLVWTAKHINDFYRTVYLANAAGTAFDSQGYEVDSNSDYALIKDSQVNLSDINGDKRSDLVWNFTLQGKAGRAVYLAQTDPAGKVYLGKASYEVDADSVTTAYTNNTFQTGDVNGDGKSDLLWTYTFQNEFIQVLYLANENGSGFNKISLQKDGDIFPNVDLYKDHAAQLGDVNSDGKADLVLTYNYNNQLGRVVYLASTLGTSFVKKSQDLEPLTSLTPNIYTNKKTRLADLNGDGKTDIVYTYNKDYTFGWVAFIANINGEGFTKSNSGETNQADPSYQNQDYLLGDINADGKADLVWVYNTSAHVLERTPFTLPSSHPDHIVKFTDGLGVETQVSYRYLSDNADGFYVKGASKGYPFREDNGLSYAVESVKQSNGVGGFNQWNYFYSGARTHLTGRGFVGFEKRATISQQTGFITTETYRQDYPFVGLEQSTIVTKSNGSPIEKSFKHWQQTPVNYTSTATTFRSLKDSVSLKYDLNDGNEILVSVTENTYDTLHGSLTNSVTSTGLGFSGLIDANYSEAGFYNGSQISNKEQTISATYQHLNDTGANWRLGFIQKTTKRYQSPGNPDQVIESHFTPYNAQTFQTRIEQQFVGSNVWQTKTFDRDLYGNITKETITAADIAGGTVASRSTSYGPHISGLYPSTSTNALLHTKSYIYNPRIGSIAQHTDQNGLITDSIYDDFGRLVYKKEQDSSDVKVKYAYCATGCPANAIYKSITTVTNDKQVGQNGQPKTTQYFDKLNRVVRTETEGFDGRTIYVDKTYDNRGRLYLVTEPHYSGDPLFWTNYDYDDLDRVVKETRADGSENSTTYSSDPSYAKRLTISKKVINPDASTRTLTSVMRYNAVGQLIETTDAKSIPTKFAYTAKGDLRWTQVDNNAATAISIETDIAGNRTRLLDPDAGEIVNEFDGLGNIRRITQQPAGIAHVTTNNYDVLNRITQRTDSDGTITETGNWSYDTAANGLGLLASLSGTDFEKTFSYNALSRLSSTSTQLFSEATPKTFNYQYDVFSRGSTTQYPSSMSVLSTYNTRGYLTSVKNVENSTAYWQATAMDARQNITYMSYANGLVTKRSYEPKSGRIKSIQTGPLSDTNEIQNLNYTFDTLGNIHSRSSNSTVSAENLNETFTYDVLSRILSATTTGLASGTRSLIYAYDNLGNIKSKTGTSDTDGYSYGANGAGPHAVTSVSLAGATTVYGYDTKGNMTSNGNRTIDYSVFNKPTQITKGSDVIQLRYGPDRKRFYQNSNSGGTVTETHYYGDGSFEIVQQGQSIREKAYIGDFLIYSTIKIVGSSASTDNHEYLHRDHLGSVESITDNNAELITKMAFAPFGSRRQSDWENSNSSFEATLADTTFTNTTRGFTNHEHLDSVGLIHMNGRVYDPEIGRFLSPDRFIQAPEFSQSFNRYAYVHNNPLSNTDPDGNFVITGTITLGILAWRAYSAVDTVTTTIENSKTVFDETKPTFDRVAAGLEIGASVVGISKPARVFIKKVTKGDGAKSRKSRENEVLGATSQTKKTSGSDSNIKKKVETNAGNKAENGQRGVKNKTGSDQGDVAKEISISRDKYGEAADHIADAQKAGHKDILTIARDGARPNRKASIGGLPKVPGKQLDEYPPAMFKEGGKGASVRAIKPKDNMAAGACIGNACRGLSNGEKVRIKVTD